MKIGVIKKIALGFAGVCLIGLCLYACKKDYVKPRVDGENNPVDNPIYDLKAKTIVGKIKHFESQLEQCRTTRSDEFISVDSAVWNMEALFNVSYTFPEVDYIETVNQELTFTVELDENGNLSMNSVTTLYDEITNSVRDAYSNDGITVDKSLMTVVFEKGETAKGEATIKVSVVSGRGSGNGQPGVSVGGPFKPGDCWYFGEFGGTCDDPSVVGDAATVIADSLNHYYAGTPVPVDGFRYINYNLFNYSLDGSEYVRSNGVSYIYNSNYSIDTDLYMDYDRLNFYFNGVKKVILQLLPSDLEEDGLMPDNPAFMHVTIRGLYDGGVSYHATDVTYCNRILVPINEIGPARNLLN